MLAHEGKRVVVCDRRPAIGGAWRCETVLGYVDVEVGCHIFPPGVGVALALQALWHVSLSSLSPPPRTVVVVKGWQLESPYGAPFLRGIVLGLRAVKRLVGVVAGPRRTGSVREAIGLAVRSCRLLAQSVRTRWEAPGPLLYPNGGTGEMVRALAARAREAGVDLRLECEVAAVSVDADCATLTLGDGSILRAAQVVLTRGSTVGAINGLVLPRREQVRRHWVAVVDDATPAAFSYLQFQGHPAIERVSDVTKFARQHDGRPVEPHRKILCFYVKNAICAQGRSQVEEVLLQVMKARRWIGPSAVVVASHWSEDTEVSRDHRPLAMLEGANPGVRTIREINLGAYLLRNLQRAVAAG